MKTKLIYSKNAHLYFIPLWIEALVYPEESIILTYE